MTPKRDTSAVLVKAEMQPSPLTAMDALASYVTAMLIAATCIAIVTAAAVQLLRPLLSAGNQMRCIYDWGLERLRRSYQKVHSFTDQDSWLTRQAYHYPILIAARSEALDTLREAANKPIRTLRILLIKWGRDLIVEQFGIRTRPAMLSDEVFMAGIQNEVRSVIARPADNVPLFLVATADLSAVDQIDLLTLNCAARRDPSAMARLLAPVDTKDNSMGKADDQNYDLNSLVATLEDVASGSMETALDQLQRRLLSRRSIVSRLFTLTLALLVSMGAAWASSVMLSVNVYAVGFISGLLAVALRDMLGVGMKRLPR